jgi:hypothetical protein
VNTTGADEVTAHSGRTVMYRIVVGYLDGKTEFFELDSKEAVLQVISQKMDRKDVVFLEVELW